MSSEPAPAGVPAALREDERWTAVERGVESPVDLPTATVRGHTTVYEDAALREAVQAATDGAVDRTWRFVFATRLVVSPPPSTGLGTAALFPTVAAAARASFGEDLADRGFAEIDRRRAGRVRVDTGDRATLTRYDAVVPVRRDGERRDLPVGALLAVWSRDGSFRVAGGGYPVDGFAAVLDDDERAAAAPRSGSEYRAELLDLLRGVE